MKNQQNQTMENMCRICMQTTNLTDIFQTRNIAEKIMLCASVSVIENDGLPQKICTDCMNELDICIKFKEKCERTARTLRLNLNLKQKESQFVFNINEENGISDILNPSEDDLKENCINSSNFLSPTRSVDDESIATDSTKKISSDIEEHTNISENTEYSLVNVGSDKYFCCDHCANKFSYKLELENHVKEKHRKSNRCKFCNRDFLSERYLKIHYLSKHDVNINGKEEQKKHECTFCNKIFLTKHTLLLHQKIHSYEVKSSSKSIHKDSINKNYLIKRLLQKKQRNKESMTSADLEVPLKCEECGKVASEISEFKKHAEIHSNMKSLTCSRCGKKFKCSSTKHCHEKKCV